ADWDHQDGLQRKPRRCHRAAVPAVVVCALRAARAWSSRTARAAAASAVPAAVRGICQPGMPPWTVTWTGARVPLAPPRCGGGGGGAAEMWGGGRRGRGGGGGGGGQRQQGAGRCRQGGPDAVEAVHDVLRVSEQWSVLVSGSGGCREDWAGLGHARPVPAVASRGFAWAGMPGRSA